MAGEAFSWREGTCYFWTATATASAVPAYIQNTKLAFSKGFTNRVQGDGSYWDHLTGQRVDVSIGAMFAPNDTVARWFDSGVMINARFNHSGVNGSAGFSLWSGRIDRADYDGTEKTPYRYSVSMHFNVWSAYG